MIIMALRQFISSCSGPAATRIEGLCGRLRDTVQDEDDSVANNSAMLNNLTTLEGIECNVAPVPKEISVPLVHDMNWSSIHTSLEEESDILIGLEILSVADDPPRDDHPEVLPNEHGQPVHYTNWRLSNECSWTYSTTSSHGRDLQEFMKFDDGSSYSSGFMLASGKPPLPEPVSRLKKKEHKKTISSGTATTVTTSTSRGSVSGLV